MKTAIKSILVLLTSAMTLSSCNKDDVLCDDPGQSSGLRPMAFKAVQQEQSAVKTVIDNLDIKWAQGDMLSVFDGAIENFGNQKFTISEGAGTTTAIFTGMAAATPTYYALYPYSENASLFKYRIEDVVLPYAQILAEGQTVDPKATVMMGMGTDTGVLSFKNVCAYVKLSVAFPCTGIIFESNGEEMLSGTVRLDYNDGSPTATVTRNGSNRVTLSADLVAGGTCYIAMNPVTLESGFTITFVTENGIFEKSSSKALTLARSHVINLGSFALGNLIEVEGKGKGMAYANGIGLVHWVQLWENGPKFADYNIGLDISQTIPWNAGGFYAWGGCKNKGFDFKVPSQDPISGEFSLDPLSGDDDTATKLWGSNWRMPTKDEFEALITNCETTFIHFDYGYDWSVDVSEMILDGLLCTGRGDYSSNSIFFPAGGLLHDGFDPYFYNEQGHYWTSTPYNPAYVYELKFDKENQKAIEYISTGYQPRYYVRAVLAE